MAAAVSGVNRLLTGFFDLLFRPLGALGPILSLTLFSAATGLLMVWIFGRFSRQEKIRSVKNGIQANLIALRLYQHSFRIFLRIQGRLLGSTLSYMALSLRPMMVMIVPVLLILIQLNGRYGVRPLETGESAVVTVRLSGAAFPDESSGIGLLAGEGVTVETPPVRIPSRSEVVWRVRATGPGKHVLAVNYGGRRTEKMLVAGPSTELLSATRTGEGIGEQILHPGEAPLDPSGPIRAFTVGYPQKELFLFGWETHWLVLFFVLSIACGYLLKGPLGVEV